MNRFNIVARYTALVMVHEEIPGRLCSSSFILYILYIQSTINELGINRFGLANAMIYDREDHGDGNGR